MAKKTVKRATKRRKPSTPQNRRLTGVKKLRGELPPEIGKATQFQPGQSGNPGGRPRRKPFLEELEKQLAQNPKILPLIVKKAIDLAKDGELKAITELRDVLDGKPAIVISGDNADPIQVEISVARDKLIGKLASR